MGCCLFCISFHLTVNLHSQYRLTYTNFMIFLNIYDYFILYQVIVMEGPITERFAKAAADRNSSTAAPT